MSKKRVVIIGAGASGLIAAGKAAQGGSEVILLEKMKLPGRKIGISGKGRCNITNTCEIDSFIDHFGRNGKFLRQSFNQFFNQELITFLESLDVPLKTERGGRVFPQSNKAVEVVKALEKWVRHLGVKIITNSAAISIRIKNNLITAVTTATSVLECDAVIICTGGASYPRTGSTGDGYKFARQCGHTTTPIRPSLVPLTTQPEQLPVQGDLHLKNVLASLYINGKKKTSQFGELTLSPQNISGPVVLTLSEICIPHLIKQDTVSLSLDLKPALDVKKLDDRIQRDIQKRHKETLSSMLGGLIPRDLISICLTHTALPPTVLVSQLKAKERKIVVHWLKNFTFNIVGFGTLEEAIVTAGGVKLSEINPNTMQSKIINNLFVAGELLDIHGDTGGFNLQAAFSTGWVAGVSVADTF